jgi:23S rRNA (guanosine2251-2'-O)-methyltransferase
MWAADMWKILRAIAEGGTMRVQRQFPPIDLAVKGAQKIAIVLGAEGPGLRPAVANACAELARIQIASEMESLNVSNAAAIAFYEASRGSFPAG